MKTGGIHEDLFHAFIALCFPVEMDIVLRAKQGFPRTGAWACAG
jgi:hypothetical protein